MHRQKVVKVAKQHSCATCAQPIHKGTLALLAEATPNDSEVNQSDKWARHYNHRWCFPYAREWDEHPQQFEVGDTVILTTEAYGYHSPDTRGANRGDVAKLLMGLDDGFWLLRPVKKNSTHFKMHESCFVKEDDMHAAEREAREKQESQEKQGAVQTVYQSFNLHPDGHVTLSGNRPDFGGYLSSDLVSQIAFAVGNGMNVRPEATHVDISADGQLIFKSGDVGIRVPDGLLHYAAERYLKLNKDRPYLPTHKEFKDDGSLILSSGPVSMQLSTEQVHKLQFEMDQKLEEVMQRRTKEIVSHIQKGPQGKVRPEYTEEVASSLAFLELEGKLTLEFHDEPAPEHEAHVSFFSDGKRVVCICGYVSSAFSEHEHRAAEAHAHAHERTGKTL